MPLQTCPKCNRFHYVPGDCPPAAKAASAVASDVPRAHAGSASSARRGESATEPHEVPKGAPAKTTSRPHQPEPHSSAGEHSGKAGDAASSGKVGGSIPPAGARKGASTKSTGLAGPASGRDGGTANTKPAHKSSGGSSAVERTPSKRKVAGSTPARRSKKSTALGKDRAAAGTGGRSARKGKAGEGSHAVAQPDRAGACEPAVGGSNPAQQAGTQAPPVDLESPEGDGESRSRRASVAPAPAELLAEAETKAAHLAPAKRGRGRPSTIADMKAYKAQKAREYRAARKAGK